MEYENRERVQSMQNSAGESMQNGTGKISY